MQCEGNRARVRRARRRVVRRATLRVGRRSPRVSGDPRCARVYAESALGLADIDFETRGIHHAGDAVFHELVFSATHCEHWRGLPPTGRIVRYPMLNVFLFEEDRLICERMYFDLLTPLRQLGIARDPTSWSGRVAITLNHPLVVARALVRSMLHADQRLPR